VLPDAAELFSFKKGPHAKRERIRIAPPDGDYVLEERSGEILAKSLGSHARIAAPPKVPITAPTAPSKRPISIAPLGAAPLLRTNRQSKSGHRMALAFSGLASWAVCP
jgi:hypothetical protein